MKVVTYVFFTFLLTNTALSQKLRNREHVYDKLFTKTEIPPEFSDNLSNYVNGALRGNEFPNKGRVIIEVIVDSIGASHFKYSYDHTDGDVSNLNLKQIINNMPAWTPAKQNGYAVNFVFILLLDFSNGELIQVRDKSMSEEIKYMLNSN